jgi:hypothetical protein
MRGSNPCPSTSHSFMGTIREEMPHFRFWTCLAIEHSEKSTDMDVCV